MRLNSTHTLVLIMVAAACSSMRVASHLDRSMSLTGFETYAWGDPEATSHDPSITNNELLDRRVREVVDRKMAAKGYRLVNPEHSHLLIRYHAAAEKKLDIATEYRRYRLGTDPYARETARTQVFKEGTLILDVEDPTSQRLIWRGWAVDTIDNMLSPKKAQPKIETAVNKILDRFPDCPRAELVQESKE